MCYFEDIKYQVKRIIRSQHEFTMDNSYQINPVSFLNRLTLVCKIEELITSNIFFSSRTVDQIFLVLPLSTREKFGDNINTIICIITGLTGIPKECWLVNWFHPWKAVSYASVMTSILNLWLSETTRARKYNKEFIWLN